MEPESDETQRQAQVSGQPLAPSPTDISPTGNQPRPKKWRSCFLIPIGLLALAAAYFGAIYAYNTRGDDQKPETTATTTRIIIVVSTPHSPLAPEPTTEVAITEEAPIITLEPTGDQALVSFIDGEVFKTDSGNLIQLRLKDGLSSPTSLISYPNSGVYLGFTDSSDSASFLYLFYDSSLSLVFDDAFNPQLLDGRLYLQSGLDDAAIHFPNHHNTVAILEGRKEMEDPSRMLVETVGSDIWIWCLHGVCYLENEQGDRTPLPPMTKSLYHSETDTLEFAISITPEELWTWQVACAYRCLTGFATRPIPTETPTPTSRYSATPTRLAASTLDPTSTKLPPTPTYTPNPYPALSTPTQGTYPYP